MKRSALSTGKRRTPSTVTRPASRSDTCTPNWRSAPSMTRVSAETSKPVMTVVPSAIADSSSTRLEILLEPGKAITPCACRPRGRSR
ncbi:hypothetical protein G6F59_013765 [Rhizopus arrhizus]|nr:hypothetical protein G6F59_013765 [Rhizopus arrhizus]